MTAFPVSGIRDDGLFVRVFQFITLLRLCIFATVKMENLILLAKNVISVYSFTTSHNL